jgi:RNA polymerase sigma-70 factor (sigma-E family)
MGADDGFVEFVSARWSRLFRLAYLLTGDRTNAEDLLQSAMERTYARWGRVSRMDAPEAYVRKLMTNVVISARRRPSWRHEWLRDDFPERPLPSPDSDVVDHAVLWPLVCALPERQRAVIVLRFYEDLSEADTADVLGCAVGTIKSQSHVAMRALRRGLDATSLNGQGAHS